MPGAASKKPSGDRALAAKKSVAAKKPAAKKLVKKPAPKKTSAPKPVKSTPAKKSVGKKPAIKKASVKKAPVKKAPAKSATQQVAKKSPEKKLPVKKTPEKKSLIKKLIKKPATKSAPKSVAKAVPAKAAGARKKTVICELSGFEVTPSAPALGTKTLGRLRTKLMEEKDRLLRQADELTAEAEQLARDREAGDTQFDEESGEGDTVNIERERDLLLSSQARQVVEAIDVALVRMKRGGYGVCRYAGRKIPLERLEAIPWADVCVDCKARAERRR